MCEANAATNLYLSATFLLGGCVLNRYRLEEITPD